MSNSTLIPIYTTQEQLEDETQRFLRGETGFFLASNKLIGFGTLKDPYVYTVRELLGIITRNKKGELVWSGVPLSQHLIYQLRMALKTIDDPLIHVLYSRISNLPHSGGRYNPKGLRGLTTSSVIRPFFPRSITSIVSQYIPRHIYENQSPIRSFHRPSPMKYLIETDDETYLTNMHGKILSTGEPIPKKEIEIIHIGNDTVITWKDFVLCIANMHINIATVTLSGFIITAYEEGVIVWNPQTGKVYRWLRFFEHVIDITVTNGYYLIIVGYTQYRIINFITGENIQEDFIDGGLVNVVEPLSRGFVFGMNSGELQKYLLM